MSSETSTFSNPPATQRVSGEPTWIDLIATDVAKARAFYGGLFGWEFHDGGEQYGHYTTVTKDGKAVAGLMEKTPDMGDLPDVWSVYLLVDDARATIAAAREANRPVYVEAMDVGDLGVMGVIADPADAAIGLWQARSFAGFEKVAEPGAAAWFELSSTDYQAAVSFYRDVFGWQTETMSDTPEFRCTTLGAGEHAKAGIWDASGVLPAGTPSAWMVYFAVPDTDAAIETAKALGGSLVEGPEDSEWGRVARLADDQGAHFKIISSDSEESSTR